MMLGIVRQKLGSLHQALMFRSLIIREIKEARNVSRLTDVNLAMEMNANATKPGRTAFWYHLILILSNLLRS